MAEPAFSVAAWLGALKLSQYVPNFVDNGYDDLRFVVNICAKEDLAEIGVKIGHRVFLLQECEKLRSPAVEAPDVAQLKLPPYHECRIGPVEAIPDRASGVRDAEVAVEHAAAAAAAPPQAVKDSSFSQRHRQQQLDQPALSSFDPIFQDTIFPHFPAPPVRTPVSSRLASAFQKEAAAASAARPPPKTLLFDDWSDGSDSDVEFSDPFALVRDMRCVASAVAAASPSPPPRPPSPLCLAVPRALSGWGQLRVSALSSPAGHAGKPRSEAAPAASSLPLCDLSLARAEIDIDISDYDSYNAASARICAARHESDPDASSPIPPPPCISPVSASPVSAINSRFSSLPQGCGKESGVGLRKAASLVEGHGVSFDDDLDVLLRFSEN